MLFSLTTTATTFLVTVSFKLQTKQHPFVKPNNSNRKNEEKIEIPGQSLHHKLDSLRRLKDLLDSGVLSEEEYENEKEKLLRR